MTMRMTCRAAVGVLWSACASPKLAAHDTVVEPTERLPAGWSVITAGGTVTATGGQPIKDAEVAICECESVECNAVANDLVVDTRAPSAIWATSGKPSGMTFVRTDAQGRWSARTKWCGYQAVAYIWAPAHAYSIVPGTTLGAGPVQTMLAPAVTLEVEAMCAAPPCAVTSFHVDDPPGAYPAGTWASGIGDFTLPPGTQQRVVFHHLPAGTYRFLAVRRMWAAGEEMATASVDTMAGENKRVEIAMKRTGTGKALTGTLAFDVSEMGYGAAARDQIEVHARCGERLRISLIRGTGRFQIDDIPPGPCGLSFTWIGATHKWPLCKATDIADVGNTYVRSLKFCPPPQQPLGF